MKQELKGAEWDWVTKWRHLLCYTGRAGVGKSIKRGMAKRFRKDAKKSLCVQVDEITD